MWVRHEKHCTQNTLNVKRSKVNVTRSCDVVHNFSPFIRNRGRWTGSWGQFLDRKQDWRYFCACVLKKSPKHSENVFRQKSYLPVIGNLRRRSEWRGQIFYRKFLYSRFCACAVKICPKLAYNVKSPKFCPLYGKSQSLNTTVFKPDIKFNTVSKL